MFLSDESAHRAVLEQSAPKTQVSSCKKKAASNSKAMETQTTRRPISKRTCAFCNAELAKNKMTQHLKSCKQRLANIPTRHSCKWYTAQHEKGLFQKSCA